MPARPSAFSKAHPCPSCSWRAPRNWRCPPWPCSTAMDSTVRRAFTWPPCGPARGRTSEPKSRCAMPASVPAPPPWLPHRIPSEPVRWALLAETQSGYQNLCRLITRFKLREPHKAEGSALLAEVAEFCQGLICLTGGDEGPLASALARGGYDEALREVERLVHIFGPHHVFVELQRHYDRAEEHRNQAAVAHRAHAQAAPAGHQRSPLRHRLRARSARRAHHHPPPLHAGDGGPPACAQRRALPASPARDAAALPRSSRGHRQHRRTLRAPRLSDERSRLPLPCLSRPRWRDDAIVP